MYTRMYTQDCALQGLYTQDGEMVPKEGAAARAPVEDAGHAEAQGPALRPCEPLVHAPQPARSQTDAVATADAGEHLFVPAPLLGLYGEDELWTLRGGVYNYIRI